MFPPCFEVVKVSDFGDDIGVTFGCPMAEFTIIPEAMFDVFPGTTLAPWPFEMTFKNPLVFIRGRHMSHIRNNGWIDVAASKNFWVSIMITLEDVYQGRAHVGFAKVHRQPPV